jgi:hypothetical protein
VNDAAKVIYKNHIADINKGETGKMKVYLKS